MTPEAIRAIVAEVFGVRVPRRPKQHSPSGKARQVWAYLLCLYLPRPAGYPTGYGGVRRLADQDGNRKAVARLLGCAPSAIRYMCNRVEDLRDDPAFDAKVTQCEERIGA